MKAHLQTATSNSLSISGILVYIDHFHVESTMGHIDVHSMDVHGIWERDYMQSNVLSAPLVLLHTV